MPKSPPFDTQITFIDVDGQRRSLRGQITAWNPPGAFVSLAAEVLDTVQIFSRVEVEGPEAIQGSPVRFTGTVVQVSTSLGGLGKGVALQLDKNVERNPSVSAPSVSAPVVQGSGGSPGASHTPRSGIPVPSSATRALEEALETYKNANAFDIFGVALDATDADIERAYCALMNKYHPDRFERSRDERPKELSSQIAMLLNAALATLSDPKRRAAEPKPIASLPPPVAPAPPLGVPPPVLPSSLILPPPPASAPSPPPKIAVSADIATATSSLRGWTASRPKEPPRKIAPEPKAPLAARAESPPLPIVAAPLAEPSAPADSAPPKPNRREETATYHLGAARALRAAGDLKAAIKTYELVLRAEPENALAVSEMERSVKELMVSEQERNRQEKGLKGLFRKFLGNS